MLRRLRTLTLVEQHHVDCKDDDGDVFSGAANHTVCQAIKDILKEPPAFVEHLRFRFRLRAFGTGSAGQLMDNFGWDELKATTIQCEKLEKVTFVFEGRPEGDSYLQEAVENQLHVLNGRGVLRIEFVPLEHL